MKPNFFLNEKPVRALLALSDENKTWYASMLSKEIDCTYAHLSNVLDEFADSGLVTFEREGRVKLIQLTEKGEDLAHSFKPVFRSLEKL